MYGILKHLGYHHSKVNHKSGEYVKGEPIQTVWNPSGHY